jgi:hypothetical protein
MRSKCVVMMALCAALAATACHKRTPVAAAPTVASPPVVPRATPPPVVAPGPEPLPRVAPPPPDALPLEQASHAFTIGNYDDAARSYETYLRTNPSGRYRDEALFYSALIYLSRPVPKTDWQRGSATLKQLIEEHPNSPFRAPATMILSLRAEIDQAASDVRQRDQKIKQLTTELDRLKKIDADRRRRP